MCMRHSIFCLLGCALGSASYARLSSVCARLGPLGFNRTVKSIPSPQMGHTCRENIFHVLSVTCCWVSTVRLYRTASRQGSLELSHLHCKDGSGKMYFGDHLAGSMVILHRPRLIAASKQTCACCLSLNQPVRTLTEIIDLNSQEKACECEHK